MDQEERRRKLELQAKYKQRIQIAKIGHAAFKNKKFSVAIKNYREYLSVVCEYKNANGIFSLAPSHFDEKTHVTELLLISHIYWDLSKMFETNPNYKNEYAQSINQFVKFTSNQPFQVLNAEMVRKYIRSKKRQKKMTEELKSLNEVYSQIYAQSKSCFIASACYHDQHPVTQSLRQFKNQHLMHWYGGLELIRYYYIYSPKLLPVIQNYPILKKIINPLLRALAFTSQTSIFIKCSSLLKSSPRPGSKHF